MTSSLAPHIDVHWQRAHPGFIVMQAISTLRSLAFPFVAIFVARGMWRDPFSNRSLVVLGVFAAVLIFSLIGAYMEWRFYRYTLADDRVIVRSGWISRKEREIPYQRIQSVDVLEGPVYRLLGLAELKVDTAGGAGMEAELQIKALPKAAASDVRDHLLHHRLAASARPAAASAAAISSDPSEAVELADPAPQPEVLEGDLIRKLSTRDLLIAGATSGTIAPVLAVVGTIIGIGDEFVPNSVWNRVPWESGERLFTSAPAIALTIAIVALLAWIMAILGTVLTYGGYEIRRQGDYLFVQHGLLDRRRKTIPLHRIQAVEMNEGPLRLPFGLCSLSYSRAGGNFSEGASGGVLFPILRTVDVPGFLSEAAPEFADLGRNTAFSRPPQRALRRYIVEPTIAVMAALIPIIAGLNHWTSQSMSTLAPLAVLVLIPMILSVFSWRDAGWFVSQRDVVLRNRGVSRVTALVPRARIQERQIGANALQRRADLANFTVRVAGGSFGLRHLDQQVAERLLVASKRLR